MGKIQCADCSRSFASQMAHGQHRSATHDNPDWTPAKASPPAPECPKCGKRSALSNGKWGVKAECCGLWSWNMKPLTDRDTHAARIQAHAAFDPLWKSGAFSRGEGYRRLQIATNMTSAECHIGQMTRDQAVRVVEIVRSGRLLELADA